MDAWLEQVSVMAACLVARSALAGARAMLVDGSQALVTLQAA